MVVPPPRHRQDNLQQGSEWPRSYPGSRPVDPGYGKQLRDTLRARLGGPLIANYIGDDVLSLLLVIFTKQSGDTHPGKEATSKLQSQEELD